MNLKLYAAALLVFSASLYAQTVGRTTAPTVTNITGSTPVVVAPSGTVFNVSLQPCTVGQVLQWQATPAPAGYKCATITTVQNDFWRSNTGATLPDGTTDTTETISRTGNVGIGTGTPNAQLQLGNTVANRKIVMYEDANNDHQVYGFGVAPGNLRTQLSSNGVDFTVNAGVNATTSNELFRVKGTGNVGIGTGTPTEKLDVAGNVRFSGALMPNNTAGTAGQVLASAGAGVAPTWQPAASVDLWRDGAKPNQLLTAVGTITYTANGELTWTNRLIAMGGGTGNGLNGAAYAADGYYNISMPPVGTVITGAGGNVGNLTVTAAGIPLTTWGTLYYKLSGGTSTALNANWTWVGFAVPYNVTSDMVPIATVNADSTTFVRVGTGHTLARGDSVTAGKLVAASPWAITGNAGTIASAHVDIAIAQTGNYIGTQDNTALAFYTNGASATNNKSSMLLNPVTATTAAVTPSADILTLRRNGVNSVTYPNTASFALGKHTAGLGALTQLDIRVNNGNINTPDTTVMSFYSTGNAGVGLTQAAASKWVIQNTANATGALKLTSTTTAAGDSWWLGFGHGANSADANDRARIGVNMSAAGAGRLTFSTGAAGAQTERVRIDEAGRLSVGLGATAAVDLLSLQGGALSFNNPANPVPYVGVDFDQTTDGLRFRTNQGAGSLNTTNMFLSRSSGNFGIGNGASTSPNSQLQVAGSFSVPLNVATTSLTVTAAMHTVSVNNAAANVTITLPTPVGADGRIYVIKRDAGSIGTVTIATAAGTVQGLAGTFGATTTLSAAGLYGQHVHFQSDGAKWHRIN